MGAYYQGVIENDEGKKRYSTWMIGQGSKLMEHSYIGNEYVERVLSLLENKPGKVTWLCDYTEPDGDNLTWDNTDEVENKEEFEDKTYEMLPTYIIFNHTDKLYIDMKELLCIHPDRTFMMHPIPFYCNSEPGAMGGGDLHQEELRRGLWKGHNLEIVFRNLTKEELHLYDNITEDSIFTEDR